MNDYHLGKKKKKISGHKKIVDTSFNNLFEMLISMIRHKWQTKSNQKKKNPMGQMGNLDPIPPNVCNFLSHDPIYRYLSNVK